MVINRGVKQGDSSFSVPDAESQQLTSSPTDVLQERILSAPILITARGVANAAFAGELAAAISNAAY